MHCLFNTCVQYIACIHLDIYPGNWVYFIYTMLCRHPSSLIHCCLLDTFNKNFPTKDNVLENSNCGNGYWMKLYQTHCEKLIK